MEFLQHLNNIVGPDAVTTSTGDLEHYGRDWTRFTAPQPVAVVFVSDEKQLVRLVALARQEKIGLVPSGGRTGLSGGACATNGEVVVSFDRMNRVLGFSEADRSITVEAGMVTANLQAHAADRGLFYPVDFASSGSSQVGGNIATNAGGIRVLRYGMTRDQILGLKVITGRGEILSVNQGLIKNNTGYDLRHLFVGSEGTLGFIVEATVALKTPPRGSRVMLMSLGKMEDCISVLGAFRQKVILNAFEFFSSSALQHVLAAGELSSPFERHSDYYVLLEFEEATEDDLLRATEAYESCVSGELVTDGILASSEQQNRSLWQYRERISESITPYTPYKNDVSVAVSNVPAFLRQAEEVVRAGYPEFEIVWFGHIGDGNLHLNILKPDSWAIDRFKTECEQVSEQLLQVVHRFAGSVSAEHGIGLLKREQLHYSRTPEEIEALKAIKQVFDPDGIMNPGKLLKA